MGTMKDRASERILAELRRTEKYEFEPGVRLALTVLLAVKETGLNYDDYLKEVT